MILGENESNTLWDYNEFNIIDRSTINLLFLSIKYYNIIHLPTFHKI